MTAYASNTTGDWATAGNWTPSGPPVDGDTAAITAGDVITAAANVTVGESLAEGLSDAITVNGSLIVAEDVTLTCRGELIVANTKSMTMALGSTLKYDSSQEVGDPTNQNYSHQLGPGGHGRAAVLVCNGTEAKPVTITSQAGGGNGFIDHPAFWQSGQVQATWTNFSNLGTASQIALRLRPISSQDNSLSDCTFDSCGKIQAQGGTTGQVLTLDRVTCTNSLNTASISYAVGDATHIRHCSFDGKLELGGSVAGGEISNCYLEVGITRSGTSILTAFYNNLYRATASVHYLFKENPLNCYFLHDYETGNPHMVGFGAASITIDGFVFEYTGSFVSDEGDMVLGGDASCVVQQCISLPNFGDSKGNPLVSLNGQAGDDVSIIHNTIAGDIAYYGESYGGHAGIVPVVKSNLPWKPSGDTTRYKARRLNASTVQDGFTASGCSHNWRGSGIADGNAGRGWHNENAGTTLWAAGDAAAAGVDPQDLQGDPDFVDSTRNLATWGENEHPVDCPDGTVAQALAVLQGDTTEIAELLTWVKAGFAVQNAALKDAGHDSVTIGAVEALIAPTVPVYIPKYVNSMRVTANFFGNITYLDGSDDVFSASLDDKGVISVVNQDGSNQALYRLLRDEDWLENMFALLPGTIVLSPPLVVNNSVTGLNSVLTGRVSYIDDSVGSFGVQFDGIRSFITSDGSGTHWAAAIGDSNNRAWLVSLFEAVAGSASITP